MVGICAAQPFPSKAFATSINHGSATWCVEQFRMQGPAQDPMPLPYLRQAMPNNYDMQLDVALRAAPMDEAANISSTNFKPTCTGRRGAAARAPRLIRLRHECRRSPGVQPAPSPGPEKNQRGSLLEISWNGTEQFELPSGVDAPSPRRRRLLVMRGWCYKATAIASALAESRGRLRQRSDSVRHCEERRL